MANKSVFKNCLKEDNDFADQQLADREFQIIGALTLNALSEQTRLTRGARKRSCSDERKDLLGL
jgi:hypothetical protein